MHMILINNIQKYVSLNNTEINEVHKVFQYESVKRGGILAEAGSISHYQYFVVEGCLKLFYPGAEGKDHILYFLPAQWWAGDLYSYFHQTPSQLVTQAIIDTNILKIKRNDFDHLLQEFPIFEIFFRKIYQNALAAQHKKTIESLSLTAKERYLQFIRDFPIVANNVPLKDIASYLGISPEYLSRLRNSISLNG